jgi:hypothetical protein
MSSMSEGYQVVNASFFTTDDIGRIFSWEDVGKIHKIRNGIYQRNGRLTSLLTDFGRINPCYPDAHGDTADSIIYTGNGRRGDQKLDSQNRALLDAVESEISVPLFNKLAPGKWEFLGFWRVAKGVYIFDEKQDRMVWKFTLIRLS